MKNLFTLISETENQLLVKQIEKKVLTNRIFVFKRALKLDLLDRQISDLERTKELLERVISTLENGSLTFETKDLEFDLDRDLHRQGFYLSKRILVGQTWQWTYKFGKAN